MKYQIDIYVFSMKLIYLISRYVYINKALKKIYIIYIIQISDKKGEYEFSYKKLDDRNKRC